MSSEKLAALLLVYLEKTGALRKKKNTLKTQAEKDAIQVEIDHYTSLLEEVRNEVKSLEKYKDLKAEN